MSRRGFATIVMGHLAKVDTEPERKRRAEKRAQEKEDLMKKTELST